MEAIKEYINSRIKLVNNDRTLHSINKVSKLGSLNKVLSLAFKCEDYCSLKLEVEHLLLKLESTDILLVNKKAKRVELEKLLKQLVILDDYSQKIRFEL